MAIVKVLPTVWLFFEGVVLLLQNSHLPYCLEIYPQQPKFLVPHASFHLVLIVTELCFLDPIQTSCVLSKLILRPDIFANFSNSSIVLFKDSLNQLKILL